MSKIVTFLLPLILVINCIAAVVDDKSVRLEAIKNIKNYINDSVDPCDNFYQYACGNWRQYHPLADQQFILNGHIILAKEILGEIKQLLEQETPIFNAEIELKVKEFYKSCLNTDLIAKKGYEPLMKFIAKIGNGMPALNPSWDEKEFDWISAESQLQSYGFDGLLRLKVIKTESDVNRIYVGEIGLPTSKEQYQQQTYLSDYMQKIMKIFIEKFHIDMVQADQTASEIVEFEKNLVKGISNENLHEKVDEYFINNKLEDLQLKYPNINWQKFISDSYGGSDSITIDKSKQITEIGPEYIRNLLELIEKTPKKTVANFMMWNAIRQFINVTIPEEEQHLHQTNERVNYCIRKTQQYFSKEIGIMYSHKYYDSDIQTDLQNMIDLIKKQIHSGFEKYDWIDDDTKKIIYQRLDHLKMTIIGNEKDKVQDNHFKQIAIDPEEYYLNLIHILQYNYKNFAVKLLNNMKINELLEDPTAIQSYYNNYENLLRISLGFLKAPFYTKFLPRNMKFAQIGAVLVHEIFHGFDKIGQAINLDGKHMKWWSDKSLQSYNDKTECFIKQYGQYQQNGGNANADITDNLADNGGIKFAFHTYRNWANSIQDTNPELFELEKFPGLDYTNTQLFFITHAQTWCHVAKGANDPDFVYPVEYRINIPMRNFDDFAKEFKCPEGSLMNPKDKCVLW